MKAKKSDLFFIEKEILEVKKRQIDVKKAFKIYSELEIIEAF